jgi:hypothetical protein
VKATEEDTHKCKDILCTLEQLEELTLLKCP